jgi:hypothetical protein
MMSGKNLMTGQPMGDPVIKHPAQKCRVLVDGWYGPHRRPVECDEVISLPLPEAKNMRALGRVAFLS